MRLRRVKESDNVEDRRRSGRASAGRVGGMGVVGVLVVLALGYFTGIDMTPLLQGQGNQPPTQARPVSPEDEAAAQFASRVLSTTEQVWTTLFRDQLGRSYSPPVLVLFAGLTNSPCGGASGATGPFYCPADRKAYLDTDFFTTLSRRLGAKGDFAAAYVIAHEIAHHVQNELGILGQVDQMRRQSSQEKANALTVRLELQADCLAGVWARSVDGLLEPGDLDEALNAARQIGDDTLQRNAGRVPQPHTFTHGTSAQRSRWFGIGYKTGLVKDCDTFGADRL